MWMIHIIWMIVAQLSKQRSQNQMFFSGNKIKTKFDKFAIPFEIDSRFIIDALKSNQTKYHSFTSKRNRNHNQIIDKIEEETAKMDLLKITGKQVQHDRSPTDQQKYKTYSKESKQIKIILSEPMEKIVTAISNDPDSKHYQMELNELQKLKSSPQKDISESTAIQVGERSSLKLMSADINCGLVSSQEFKESTCNLQLYQKLILNNPILYRKVMCVYKASKREIERENHIVIRKQSKRRDTALAPKNQKFSNNEIIKNPLEEKKFISILLYREFHLAINLTNRIIFYPQSELQYRAFICKGNNGLLVKSIIKSRPWWTVRSYSEIDSCNLIWTEWKRTKLTNSLPKKNKLYSINLRQAAGDKNSFLKQFINKKQLMNQAQRKYNQIKKLSKENGQILQKYVKNPSIDNYFNYTSKINDAKFEEIASKIHEQSNITHMSVQKQWKIINHVPGCLHLHSKKLLFSNLKAYYQKQNKDIFSIVPLTFLISKGVDDPEFIKFTKYFEDNNSKSKDKKNKKSNIWICKPGQNSNRGNGINVVSTLSEIRSLILSKCVSGRTLIIQKYIENPFLYNKRKFDFRCYILITTVNGIVKGYWYEDAYVRTTSKEYNLKNLDNKLIHLTNDAVQKKGEEYGKFQNCNKVSLAEFQKYVQANFQEVGTTFESAFKKIKSIATDLIYSVGHKLNPERKEFSFQIFGLDFMLDEKLEPFLIQANSNPCLEVDGNVLGKVIPTMIENMIRVAIDPIFPPPYNQNSKNAKYSMGNVFEQNKLVLVYDSLFENCKIDSNQQQKELLEEEFEEPQEEVNEE